MPINPWLWTGEETRVTKAWEKHKNSKHTRQIDFTTATSKAWVIMLSVHFHECVPQRLVNWSRRMTPPIASSCFLNFRKYLLSFLPHLYFMFFPNPNRVLGYKDWMDVRLFDQNNHGLQVFFFLVSSPLVLVWLVANGQALSSLACV